MKKINLLIALAISFGITSCNNDSEKTTTIETDNMATSATEEPAQAGPTLPMDVMAVYHTVKDYNQWRPGFDADSIERNASGLSLIAVERAVEKPNDVKIVLAPSDMTKAKAFIADPRLKDLMGTLGVTSKPEVKYWSIIRYNTENKKDGGTRLQIEHKVKDFDAWLKVYDAEGPATRAANGLNDLALGRGVDDPNLVHIVFDVTDMAKAKARIADPQLKKIMDEAGVVGQPSVTFYNDVSK